MCSAHLTNLPTSQLLFKGKEGIDNGGDSKDVSIVKCKVEKAMYLDLRLYLQPSTKNSVPF